MNRDEFPDMDGRLPDYRDRPPVDAPRIAFLNKYTLAMVVVCWVAIVVGGVGLAVAAGLAW